MEEAIDDTGKEKFKETNISLVIDTYNDIFSDFDPRSYSNRALSDDFLQECGRAVRERKESGFELRILVPRDKRNLRDEARIKKRLKEHFLHSFKREKERLKKIRMQGFAWFCLGTVFILTLAFLKEADFGGFFMHIIETILEPAGWFSFWEGLGKIFIVAENSSTGYKFYKKMAKAEINFADY